MTDINFYSKIYYIDGNFNFSSNIYELIDKENFLLINTNDLSLALNGQFDLYRDENNNIFLGYFPTASYSSTNMTYSFTLNYNDKSYIINNQDFIKVNDILLKQIGSTIGEFTFTDSQINNTSKLRCDDNRYGPKVFLRPEDPENDSDCNSPIVQTFTDLKRFTPVLSIDRIGHLIYVELLDSQLESTDINYNNMPKACVTISEMLKLMIEWSELVNSPWNSIESISVKCDSFFKAFDISDELKDEINNNQAPMQVARFFMGDNNARLRPSIEELSNITPLLRQWILSKFFFSSIDELKTNLMI